MHETPAPERPRDARRGPGDTPEKPRETQRDPKMPREAQRGPGEAQRCPEKPRRNPKETKRDPERPRQAQRDPERPQRCPEMPRKAQEFNYIKRRKTHPLKKAPLLTMISCRSERMACGKEAWTQMHTKAMHTGTCNIHMCNDTMKGFDFITL